MSDQPAVLVLVADATRREAVRQRLMQLDVDPIAVRAGHAMAALARYHPMSVLIDEPHAATTPDEFLMAAWASRVRLVTLPDGDVSALLSDATLVSVASR